MTAQPSPAINAGVGASLVEVSSNDFLPEETLAGVLGLSRKAIRKLRSSTEKGAVFRNSLGFCWRRSAVEQIAAEMSFTLPDGLPFHPAEKNAAECDSARLAAAPCAEFPLTAKVARTRFRNPRFILAHLDAGEEILVRIDPKHMTPRPMFVPGMQIGVRFVRRPNIYATRKPRKAGKW